MLLDDKKYIVYGISPLMQQCIKNAFHDLHTHSISDILDAVSDIPSLTQTEINLIIFEIGRNYEKMKQKC